MGQQGSTLIDRFNLTDSILNDEKIHENYIAVASRYADAPAIMRNGKTPRVSIQPRSPTIQPEDHFQTQ